MYQVLSYDKKLNAQVLADFTDYGAALAWLLAQNPGAKQDTMFPQTFYVGSDASMLSIVDTTSEDGFVAEAVTLRH